MNDKKLPTFLNKIFSDKKARECAAILEAPRPTHAERLWLVGFLKFARYSMSEVLDIIQEHCQWSDYNQRTTAYQVASVFHQRQVGTTNHKKRMTLRVRKWDLTPVEVLRIRYQRSVTLSKILCEENKAKTINFQHPERLACADFNPSATFLRK